jgi:hypothetical protein
MKKEVNWEQDIGKEVRLYRNLLNGLISVQHNIKGRGWILSGHCNNCVISKVSFKVSEAGRQRTLREKQRNAHAYATGILMAREAKEVYIPNKAIEIGYNPYKQGFFYNKTTGEKIEKNIKYLMVVSNKVYVEIDEKAEIKREFKQMGLDLSRIWEEPKGILAWRAA